MIRVTYIYQISPKKARMGLWSLLSQQLNPELEQPSWTAALQVLHDGDGIITIPSKDSISENHPFVTEANLSVEEAKTAFDYLEHADLIEPVEGDEMAEYVISKNGFQVAHDRELNRRQWEIDLSSAIIATGLFVVTIINIMISQFSGFSSTVLAAVVGFLFIGFLFRVPKYG